jgi:PAS domain S-box-containing protein
MLMDSDVKKKIVLVEDDNIIAFSLSKFLREKGFDVVSVSSGEEVVALAGSDAEIDLVLMDIDLGKGIDGITASEKILEYREVPVVFLTAFSDEDTIDRVNGAARYGYVVKSSGNPVMLSAIKMAFRLFDSAKVLRESEEKYRFIAENSTDIISKMDAQGNVLYMSPICKTVTGFDPAEFIGENILPHYHEDDRHIIIDVYNRLMTVSEIFTFSYRFRTKNGDYVWLETTSKRLLAPDGSVTGIISSSRDISERVKTEKALRDSEEKLHLVMDGVPALLSYVDRNERFVYVNDGYERWYGIPKENIVGKSIKELLSPDVYERASHYYKQALAGESVKLENLTRDKNGEEKYIRAFYVPHSSDGIVQGLFVLIFDITENKRAEQKILSLLNEKDLLLKEVHHRVKNNMGSIAALLYLQMDIMKNPEAVNAIQDARSRVLSMMGIYDILYRSGEYKTIAAREYFTDLLEKISSTYIISSRIKLNSEINEMTLDSGILFPVGMIVNELLTNAVKYAFPGGRSGEIKVSIIKKDEKHIEISIKDNGVGLPDALEISGSRGFGLTLVKMMIQQINGSIKINRVGGTEFKINFMVEKSS